jgi:hypothetical protein
VNQCLVFVWVIPSTKDYVAKLVLDFASFQREIQSWWRKFSFLEAYVSIFVHVQFHIPSWVIESALESESCLVVCYQNIETNVENVAFSDSLSVFEKFAPSQRSVQRLSSVLHLEVEFLSHIKDRYFDLEAPPHVIISVGQFSLFQREPLRVSVWFLE